MQRFVGDVKTVITNKGRPHGFIGLASITNEDQSPHGLGTTQDVFVHQDDCGSELHQGLRVTFEVSPDQHRGGDALRAVDVMELVVGELVLVGEDFSGSRALTDPRSLYVPPTPAQRGLMKPIAPEAVEQVLKNMPMPLVPRTRSENTESAAEITRRLMRRLFPQFAAINEGGVDMADESFDNVIRQAIDDHKAFGMQDQATHMLKQAGTYKGLRTLLRSEEDLLKPEMLIPIQYLPDLFMAVPVWYFWGDENIQRQAAGLKTAGDPEVHPNLKHMCGLVPTDRWADTFLMYNRRMRTLNEYQGDLIPPRIIARMRKMANMFDYMVIMTPYHDVAGRDWQNVQWLRGLDPYVVGFIKNIPLMFVVGRFSDSGIFPLYSELMADTIAFLRLNIEKLRGFNVDRPYWYRQHNPGDYTESGYRLGDHLVEHTKRLLSAFDAGNLFDWLRGEDGNLPAQSR